MGLIMGKSLLCKNSISFLQINRILAVKLKFHINFVYLLLEGSILDKKVYNVCSRWLSVRVTM